MKITIQKLLAAILLIAASIQIHAQGVVYDQQSATGPISPLGNGNADGLDIQEDQPLVQSFIPSLSAIDLVQLEFADIPGNGDSGATVYVDLWSGSPNIDSSTATLVASTASVYMPNGFVNNGLGVAGVATFNFSTPISLIAGQTYYLQPVVASGDNPWDIITIGNTYPNGQVFEEGLGFNTDFWFREGIESVPEPSLFALIGLSGFLFFAFKWRSKLAVLSVLAVPALPVQTTPDFIYL